MIVYLLKTSACLGIFYFFYKIALEDTSGHKIKRFYLIASVAIALCIPLITITTVQVSNNVFEIIHSNTVGLNSENTIEYDLNDFILGIYFIGVLCFGILYIHNLLKVIKQLNDTFKIKKGGFTYVLLEVNITPFTFLNYIFLNKKSFQGKEIPNQVLLHEQAHSREKHTIDILFIEIVKIFFWFNPFVYLISNSMKLNHEFLADYSVLRKGFIKTSYQQIILQYASNLNSPKFSNSIQYSSFKKRFSIMQTKTSRTSTFIKTFLIVPLIAFTLYSFSSKEVVIKKDRFDFQKNTTNLTDRNLYAIDTVKVIKGTLKLENKLERITELSKSNAKFYYENVKISSNKAIELIKSNKKLNIQTITNREKEVTVNILNNN